MAIIKDIYTIPNMRFPEFYDNWETEPLKLTNKIYDGTHQTPNYVESGVPFYSVEHVTANQFENTKFISEKVYLKENDRVKLEKGDILMTRIGSIGVAKFVNWNVRASFYVSLALIKHSKLVNGEFLSNYISSRYFQSELWKRTIHVAFPQKINLGEIGNCKIKFPSLPEQQKIASFLTAVDTKIEQLSKKKTLLETYKKGLMQKLFSQEIRFKQEDGSNYPDWEEKRLGDMGETFNGLTGKTKENFGKGKPYIEYMQVFSSPKIDSSRFGFVEIGVNENQNRVKYGDIIFTTSSETPNEIGYSSVILNEVEELYLNSFCFGYRPHSKQILNPEFSAYLFRSPVFRKEIIKLAQGSTRYNMSKVQLMKVLVNLPNVNEQNKIAVFMGEIDKKIESVNNQLEQIQLFKKGLLQQMFV